jgi:hypothetical protein
MALGASLLWCWAALVVASRHHFVLAYEVFPEVAHGLSAFASSDATLVFAVVVGGLLLVLLYRSARERQRRWTSATAWIAASAVIPLLDVARTGWPAIPLTCVEPLFLAWVTGLGAARAAGDAMSWPVLTRPGVSRAARTVLLVLCGSLGVWYVAQSRAALADLLLGYNDFGHFALRIANTWAGRGWLVEHPGLPRFWDHFNPGLLALVPLWGWYPDVDLFFWVQGACLTIGSLFVYGIVRNLGGCPVAGLVWGAAYLVYPALTQQNLNFSYGWHPISVSIPFLMAMLWCLSAGRLRAAVVAAVVAASFQENVIFELALMTTVLGAARYFLARRAEGPGHALCAWAEQLPAWGWFLAAAAWFGLFLFVYQWSGFAGFQTERFGRLGQSPLEIALSPILRPAEFWGEFCCARSFVFLAALCVPLGLGNLRRGWVFVLVAAVPLSVLLAWDHLPAKSIAFQYPASLIPYLFVAALAGAAARGPSPGRGGEDRSGAAPGDPALRARGVAVLLSCATASLALGLVPWSGPSRLEIVGATYPVVDDYSPFEQRRAGSAGNAFVRDWTAHAMSDTDSAVLATGRIAAHCLSCRRLETVGQFSRRRALWSAVAEDGRRGIELFDWILVDLRENFQQTVRETAAVVQEAERAGFERVDQQYDVLVLRQVSPSS